MTLTNEDLQKIAVEMGKVIEDNVNPQFEEIRSEIGSMKSEIGSMKSEIGGIRSQMVTKDYLDDKLADLRGDLTILMRKEDTKLIELIKVLKNKNVLEETEAKKILEMEPFPKSSL
ncbi:MAG TPA: hypothetical protein VMX18_04075 [Candidatus Bipolaricaulota bacterium]|nr:hypothetical protein [Candidatus Bipolaricaulota bacterium]